MIWAAYWAPHVAEKLGLIEGFVGGDIRAVTRIARALRTMAPFVEREQSLCALRVAYELAKLF